MLVWIKRGFLSLAILGLLVTGAAQAQNGRGQGNGAGAPADVVQLRPTGVVPGQYIVVLRDDVADPRAVANALARAHGLGLGFIYSSALKGFSASVPERALAGLARDPRVDYIEADQWVQTLAQTVPTGVARIFAPGNSNITIDGSDDYRIDVDVAVIDTGIDLDHPDLNVVGSAYFIGRSADDQNGHGSHVAGTIAGLDNDFGVVGVAPGARLWAVRVLDRRGSGTWSGVIAGIDWVTANNDIIEVANMSLGGGHNNAVCAAVENSVAQGVVHVVAAGNSDTDTGGHSPADCGGVITVSALADFDGAPGGFGSPTCRSDEDDTLANFSNFGPLVEIAAPGVCIYSAWKNGGYATISGTSMASPHVAGAAALLAASDSTLSPADILNTLIAEGNSNWTDDSGDGIPEPLLDVGDSIAFNPATVPGDGGGGTPVDSSPSVSWDSPSGGPVSGTVTIQVFASDDETSDPSALTVDWSSDGGSTWNSATYNDSSGDYEDSWNTMDEAEGNLTLQARADDGVNSPSTAQVTVTVDNVPDPTPAGVASAVVDYDTEGGKNQDKHLLIAVTALDGDGLAVSGASISIELYRDDSLDATGSGTTGVDGTITFSRKNAPSGCYTTDVAADSGDIPETDDPGICK